MPKPKASSKLKTSRSTAARRQSATTGSQKPAITRTAKPAGRAKKSTGPTAGSSANASTSAAISAKSAAKNASDPNLDEVLKIIDLMGSTDLVELELETPELKISLKRAGSEPVIQMIQAPQQMMAGPQVLSPQPITVSPRPAGGTAGSAKPAPAAPPVPEAPKVEYHKIVSPMAGTFYRAPSPSAPPYVKEGDLVKAGQPVCIIEAMKLMNEIKADKGGKIIKVPVDNAQPVEKGAALFLIDPNG